MVGAKSPADSRAPRPAKRFSAARRTPGRAVRTRRDAAYLALHAPRRTFEKRPRGTVYFSNRSRAVREPFSNAATGSPVPGRPSPPAARDRFGGIIRPRRLVVNRETIFAANRAASRDRANSNSRAGERSN